MQLKLSEKFLEMAEHEPGGLMACSPELYAEMSEPAHLSHGWSCRCEGCEYEFDKRQREWRGVQNEPERYFFDQDDSSHWYMVPENLREKWQELTENDIDPTDYERQEEFGVLFDRYRLDGGITDIHFADPKGHERA